MGGGTGTGVGIGIDGFELERKSSLFDRITTHEIGEKRERLFSIMKKLPYNLFNGSFLIYAGFFKDQSNEFILLTQSNPVHSITDINLSCERVETNYGFYHLLNNQDFDIRIYERPLMEKIFRKHIS